MKLLIALLVTSGMAGAALAGDSGWGSFDLSNVNVGNMMKSVSGTAKPAASAPRPNAVNAFIEEKFNFRRATREEVEAAVKENRAGARVAMEKAQEIIERDRDLVPGGHYGNTYISPEAKRYMESAKGFEKLATYLEKRLEKNEGKTMTRDLVAELAIKEGYKPRNWLSPKAWAEFAKDAKSLTPEDRQALKESAGDYAEQFGEKGSSVYNQNFNAFNQMLIRYDLFPQDEKNNSDEENYDE